MRYARKNAQQDEELKKIMDSTNDKFKNRRIIDRLHKRYLKKKERFWRMRGLSSYDVRDNPDYRVYFQTEKESKK